MLGKGIRLAGFIILLNSYNKRYFTIFYRLTIFPALELARKYHIFLLFALLIPDLMQALDQIVSVPL